MCRENKFWLISWIIVAIYFSFDSYMDYKTKQAEIESNERIEQMKKDREESLERALNKLIMKSGE